MVDKSAAFLHHHVTVVKNSTIFAKGFYYDKKKLRGRF